MLFKINKIMLLSVTLFSLLISITALGTNEDDLQNAILHENNIHDARVALDAGVDFQKIDNFAALPTADMAKLLLRYGMGLERFLGLVIRFNNPENNAQIIPRKHLLVASALKRKEGPNLLLRMAISGVWAPNPRAEEYEAPLLPLSDTEQEYYVTQAVAAGAAFPEVKISGMLLLPTIKVANLMLMNGINPTDILNFVLSANIRFDPAIGRYVTDQEVEVVDKKYKLAELVLATKRVDFNKLGTSGMPIFSLPSVKLSKLLLDNGLPADNLLGIVMITGIPSNPAFAEEFCATRRVLVELALSRGAKPSFLLDMVANSRWLYDLHNGIGFLLSDLEREYFISLACDQGAKLSEVELDSNLSYIPPLDQVRRFLENPDPSKRLSSDHLAIIALKSLCSAYDPEKRGIYVSPEKPKRRNDLLELALERGVDPDRLLEAVVNRGYLSRKNHMRYLCIEKEEDVIHLVLDHGAQFPRIHLIGGLVRCPPSVEAAKLMLQNPDNSLNPNDVLRLAASAECMRLNLAKQIEEIDPDLVAQRDAVITLALDHQANPNEIIYFAVPPSTLLGQRLLIQYKLDPHKYYNLISRIFCMTYNESTKRMELNADLVEQRKKLLEDYATITGNQVSAIDDSRMIAFADLLNQTMSSYPNAHDSNADRIAICKTTNRDGKNLLMLAAEGGNMGFVEKFLREGGYLSIEERQKVLDCAIAVGNSEEYLRYLTRLLKL